MYRLKRSVVLLFASGLVLAGFMSVSALIILWNQSRDWPTAQGVILELGNENARDDLDIILDLEYNFKVDGQVYSGKRLSPKDDHFFISREEFRRLRKTYPTGANVSVTYSPELPGEESFLEPISIKEFTVPGGMLIFGLWILYLQRVTRVRRVPRRVLDEQQDHDTPRWHAIYRTVLEKQQIEIRGTAWYAKSQGLSQWPKSRVGLVATPNSIGVIRGGFSLIGALAASFTICLEVFLNLWLAIIHGFSFLAEWANRLKTWKNFVAGADPNEYSTIVNTADIVSIDETIIHGYDPVKHELWFRLPSREVDDCIKLAPDMIEEIEQFIAFVRLMQRSNQISLDDHAVIDDIEFLD